MLFVFLEIYFKSQTSFEESILAEIPQINSTWQAKRQFSS